MRGEKACKKLESSRKVRQVLDLGPAAPYSKHGCDAAWGTYYPRDSRLRPSSLASINRRCGGACMLSLPPSVQIFIARAPIDMRKSFDALEGAVRNVLCQDPMTGHLFVFTNKRRDRIKILMWDRHGWAILYKRLEAGTFVLPQPDEHAERIEVEAAELALMLEGIDLTGAKRRKRWIPAKTNCLALKPPP